MPATEGPRALYVYYRVASTRSAEAFMALSEVQQTLMRRIAGLQARLMRRTDEDEGLGAEQTWMEVYEHPAGVDPLCEQTLNELVSALPAGLIGPRHVESFTQIAPLSADTATSRA